MGRPGPSSASLRPAMGSLIKKRRKRMRKKKHKKMLKRTRWQRRAAEVTPGRPSPASLESLAAECSPRPQRAACAGARRPRPPATRPRRAPPRSGSRTRGTTSRRSQRASAALPADLGTRSRTRASRGSTTSAAGSRSLPRSPAGATERRRRRGRRAGVETPNAGRDEHDVKRLESERLDDLSPTPLTQRPPAARGKTARPRRSRTATPVEDARPAEHRRRVRSHHRDRRPPGSA